MLQQSVGESEGMLRLLAGLVVVYSYALISCRQIPSGITLNSPFLLKHHPTELSEGAPPLIWILGWHQVLTVIQLLTCSC